MELPISTYTYKLTSKYMLLSWMKNTLLLIEVACGVNDATRAPARAFKLDQ